MKRIIKGSEITWFQIMSKHPKLDYSKKYEKILRFVGRTRENYRVWIGRVKLGQGFFIVQKKNKTLMRPIINL